MGLFTPTTEFNHDSGLLPHIEYELISVATKGVVVSNELVTSREGVDLGRYIHFR